MSNSVGSSGGTSLGGGAALCASCDLCRSRKTKCDGNRPCGNCASRYLKKHKLTSVENIDVELFQCVYSPAKRRGPVPGRAGQQRARAAAAVQEGAQERLFRQQMAAGMGLSGVGGIPGASSGSDILHQRQAQLAFGIAGGQPGIGGAVVGGVGAVGGVSLAGAQIGAGGCGEDTISLQRQVIQQLHAQQHPLGIGRRGGSMFEQTTTAQGLGLSPTSQQQRLALFQLHAQRQQQQQQSVPLGGERMIGQPPTQMPRNSVDHDSVSKMLLDTSSDLPSTLNRHLLLLDKSNADGNRLRAFYNLSIDELFGFPPIPTNEEYCARLGPDINPRDVPKFDISALNAARFAELALGALACNQVAFSLELSNVTVLCLRECVEDEPVHQSCMFDIARAYLLHGILRSFRGDMTRYFKYRRVCLAHLSRLDKAKGIETLLAAMSLHDSWAYMIYNADSEKLPHVDEAIPPVTPTEESEVGADVSVSKFGISSAPSKIASHPNNQMWIQGPPPVFINNEALPLSRSIDALACAIRSCCDQANARFQGLTNDPDGAEGDGGGEGGSIVRTPTNAAVTANQNELCSRNMVLSAFTLLQKHEASANSLRKNHGLHLIVSAMDAFLGEGDEDEPGGFTDSQIQSLLSVCNAAVENPLLLYQGGPTYHLVSNCAILLCHLLNSMYNKRRRPTPGEMETLLFDEVLDTFIAVRKLLNIHRRKLPALLRCHGIPHPNLFPPFVESLEACAPLIDLGETIMCGSRGCQGFVLMGCSPCVAAERAKAAQEKAEKDAEFDADFHELRGEFDNDDDALLEVLSRIVAT